MMGVRVGVLLVVILGGVMLGVCGDGSTCVGVWF